MREILLKKRDVDYKDFVKKSAVETDFDELLEGDVIGIDSETKEVIFIHAELKFDDREIMAALDNIKYEMATRSSGLKSYSRVFGFMPRRVMRGDFCNIVSMAVEHPKEHAIVTKYGVKIGQLYGEFTPEVHKKHQAMMEEKVLDEWAIKDTPFTSGIINKNNPLKYHFDSGNFKKVYSCMTVFKRDIRGGYLSLPEYGVGLALPHNSVFMFDGQEYLHGVTPITRLNDNAMRYSIVYYSLQQIWNCLPMSEEIARIRNKKTERERRRARGEVHASLRK